VIVTVYTFHDAIRTESNVVLCRPLGVYIGSLDSYHCMDMGHEDIIHGARSSIPSDEKIALYITII
jgi:hypothetical protein